MRSHPSEHLSNCFEPVVFECDHDPSTVCMSCILLAFYASKDHQDGAWLETRASLLLDGGGRCHMQYDSVVSDAYASYSCVKAADAYDEKARYR